VNSSQAIRKEMQKQQLAQERLELLFQSLQSRAFRGEL